MDFNGLALWIVETFCAAAVLFALQIPLRTKKHPVLRILVFIVKAVMIPGTALLFVAIESRIAYLHGG